MVTLSTLGCQSHTDGAGSANTFDRLPLSLDEVKQISGFDGFIREIDTDQPAADNYGPSGPCQAIADQQIAFGEDWTQFRSIADNGNLRAGGRPRAAKTVPLMAAALQNVASYPDATTAREVFDRRVTAMRKCAELNIPTYSGALSQRDPSTVVYTSGTGGMTLVFVIKSTVLVEVSILALPDAERVASDISRVILDRID